MHSTTLQSARRHMVEQQIRTADVTDAGVLALYDSIPRDFFVPVEYRQLAYADSAIPLGHGEHMMVPIVESRMIQALDVDPRHEVLVVGTGSGFVTACLARLVNEVTSIDIHRDFVDSASAKLKELGIDNVSLAVMDACRDLPPGPFDAIAVTGSLLTLDARYIAALKPGGRLFLVTGDAPIMDAQLIVRDGDETWHATSLFETMLTRLANADSPTLFRF
ncbi:MAG: protein-L-isoaspartate O-methyltransferase [Woeseia sp.]